MPRSYSYLHYDVFTDSLFGGNQLAVYLDGRGLSVATMQAIAREMNLSETTFVLPVEQPGTDFRLRIFTPFAELPMAGHPTIGSTYALAHAGLLQGRDGFVFGLNVGPTPVSLTWRKADLAFAWMTQPLPTFGAPVANPGDALRAIGLADSDLAANLPVQVVSCGVPYLLIPLATRRAVDAAIGSRGDAIDAYFQTAGVDASGMYLLSLERGADEATVYTRMFAPGLGVNEDPATGSASGPLGCYLVRHQAVPAARAGTFVNRQGVKMGRPSLIHTAIGVEGGEIATVRVGGEAVLAGEGKLYIP